MLSSDRTRMSKTYIEQREARVVMFLITTQQTKAQKKGSFIPAIGSNGSKAIGGESLTAEEEQRLEIGEGSGKELKTVVSDDHPLQTELLEGNPTLSKGLDPRVDIAAPIMRHQIEIGEMRLTL